MVSTFEDNKDLEAFCGKVDNARDLVERLRRRIESRDLEIDGLRAELDLTSAARDKALYFLLRLCEAVERKQWPSDEDLEPALNLLFEHNIFTGLPEPDNAILRLMEVVASDTEEAGDVDS